MNSGATILDDLETVEVLRDHPHLLAIADAVRATQGERTGTARQTLLLVAAVTALAGAAALIAVLVIPGPRAHNTTAVGAPTHPKVTVATSGAPGNAPGPVPLSQALSSASKSFGVPIILPDTSVLKPSDAGAIASEQWLPSPEPGVREPVSQLTVEFPSPYVSITYAPTALTDQGKTYPDALDQYQAEIAQTRNPADYQIVSLSGATPALIGTTKTGNLLEFRLGTLSIWIWAPNNNGVPTTVDAAALKTLGQSIIDRAGNQ